MTDSRYYKRTIVKKTLYSNYLKEQRELRIFLPPGYNDLSSYSVIYCQDGEEFFNFGRIATHATKLILDENLEPMIIVGAHVNLPNRTAEYSPNGNRFSAYCEFFAKELVPFIDQAFATRKEPPSRILAGDSLGGAVSLHIALQYPQLFHKLISLSGAFFRTTQNRLNMERDLSWLDVYMIVGLEETAVKTERGVFDFLTVNRETKNILEAGGAKLRYVEKPGEHTWGFWQNELPEGLKHFFSLSPCIHLS